jgi:hypothetical protein
MKDREAKSHLEALREWAQDKIDAGEEPPWAWYQYMKLVETADAILRGFSATRLADSPASEGSPGPGCAQGDEAGGEGSTPPALDARELRMPM